MSDIGRNKQILVSLVVLVCICLLLTAALLQPIVKEKTTKDDDDITTTGETLPVYKEPLVDPDTNSLNGLTNEDWFGEVIENDELTFVTDQLGTSEFNTSETSQRDNEGEGAFGGEELSPTGVTDEEDDSEKGGGSIPRDIEEADIIKLVDDTLYILNTYRGLIMVDVSEPDEPEIISRVPLFGYPVEMYIVEPKAYVILTHYYNSFLWAEGSSIVPEYRHGSEIVIIDLSDLTKPKVDKFIELDGFITDTRRVGEVIYAVANNYGESSDDGIFINGMDTIAVGSVDVEAEVEKEVEDETESENVANGEDDYDSEPETEAEPKPEPMEETEEKAVESVEEPEAVISELQQGTVVMSINFEDLNNIKQMDREWFPGSANQIHVTETAIFVAQPEYNYIRQDIFESFPTYYTNVTYVDISDYHGEIKIRDIFTVEGYLEDRYQMDYFENTFRIVTHFWGEWGELGESKLWVYDVSNPDKITKLSELLIDDAGNLMATRFEGKRAYTIHLPHSIDPLDVIDLSNPSKPVLTDILEMPGWVTHMEVRGYKILALGVDDSEGQQKVAVTLFDVTDPYNAIMKERVIIGEGYSWSTANWDPKALSVIDDQNLILVPFESYTNDKEGRFESYSGLQIVEYDLKNNDLIAGGAIEHIGTIQRTRANSERIFAISAQVLQVIDASIRDKPKITAILELCNNVVDIIPINNYCIQVISQYNYYGDGSETKLRTVSSTEPDSMSYLAEEIVKYGIQRTYLNGDFLYLICSEYSVEDNTVNGRILVYDYSNPLSPKLRSNFEMEYYNDNYYYWYYYDYYGGWYYNPQDSIVDSTFSQVNGDLIIYHPQAIINYDYTDEPKVYEDDISTDSSEPKPEEDTKTRRYYYNEMNVTEKLYIISLSDPDNPVDVVNITLMNTSRISGLYSNRESLYLLQYKETSYYDEFYRWYYQAKNFLTKVDLSTPAAPKIDTPVNIPGGFLGVSNDGTMVYTRSNEYVEDNELVNTLNVLKVQDGKAILSSSLDLGDSYPDIVISDTTILLCYGEYGYYWYRYYELDTGIAVDEAGVLKANEFLESKIKTKIQIIDAKDPKNLVLITTLGLQNFCNIYKFENNKLYLSLSETSGILIYDTANMKSPSFIGYYPIQGWINSLREDETTGKIYLACGLYGVLMIDVSE